MALTPSSEDRSSQPDRMLARCQHRRPDASRDGGPSPAEGGVPASASASARRASVSARVTWLRGAAAAT